MDILVDDDVFTVDFLTALGNMMDFSAKRADALVLIELTPTFAEEIADQVLNRRVLQDNGENNEESNIEKVDEEIVEDKEDDGELTTLRALMKKFIVIKNK